ncbi:Zinc finger protein [Plakobranchus ocellatus]|uniref:Zinc finger protein n=1 Tax=Plakobranchus ocellatus TaxID=259542 RepID=A0AAV3ZLE4_9GAST|nr:Zinc finger protein [Plakobranchus ocellatus]
MDEKSSPIKDVTEQTCVQLAPEFSERLTLADSSRNNFGSNTRDQMEQSVSKDHNPSYCYANTGSVNVANDGEQQATAGMLAQRKAGPPGDVSIPQPRMLSESQAFIDEAETASTSTVHLNSSDLSGMSEGPNYICQCGKSFNTSQHLANHKRWACSLKEKKAQCAECSTWFASEQGLRRHMRHVHGGAFKCEACGTRCRNNIHLTRHWLDAHYEDREGAQGTFKCFKCDRTDFKDKYELECHWLRHKYDRRQRIVAQVLSPPVSTELTEHHLSTHNTSPLSTSATSIDSESRSITTATRPQPHFPSHLHQRAPSYWHAPCAPHPPMHSHTHFSQLPQFLTPPPPPPPPTVPSPSIAVSTAYPHMFMPPHTYIGMHIPPMHYGQAFSNLSREKVPPPSCTNLQTPRHDHEYIEPTSLPHYHFSGFHKGHHGKVKWKKYLKLMMKGLVPPLWNGNEPGFFQQWAKPHCSKQSTVVAGDKKETSNEFKIACKFCDNEISSEWIHWHLKKECPVLMLHRCKVCDRVFRKRHLLVKHMQEQNHHTMPYADNCSDNPLADSVTLFNLHKKMNDTLRFETNAEVSQNPTLLQKNFSNQDPHSILSEPLDVNPVNAVAANFRTKCSVCMASFISVVVLRAHLQKHLEQVERVQKVRDWTMSSAGYFHIANSEDGLDTEETLSVADSDVTSTTGSALTTNSSQFSNFTASTSTDRRWTKPHKKGNSHSHRHHKHRKGEISVCDFCGEQFAFHKDLELHVKANHPGSKLQCPVCGKKFSWKKRGKFYERHMESHYGVKIFKHKCELCDKTFLEKSKLQAHIAALHTQELPYTCSVCGKSYAIKSSLVRHERHHSGARPYKCSFCSETFLEKRELVRHSATHTGVAPFSCNLCGQGFTLKTSLTAHMRKQHPVSK